MTTTILDAIVIGAGSAGLAAVGKRFADIDKSPAVEHMSYLLALATSQKMSVRQLLGIPFYQPVLEEGLRSALRDITRQTSSVHQDMATCQNCSAEALN